MILVYLVFFGLSALRNRFKRLPRRLRLLAMTRRVPANGVILVNVSLLSLSALGNRFKRSPTSAFGDDKKRVDMVVK